MQEIFDRIKEYIIGLDWSYIMTFITIAYGFNHYRIRQGLQKTGIRAGTKYRVAIVGVLYGAALYFIRGYQIAQAEVLFQSFVFALVFHKLILESLLPKLVPKTLRKHIVNEKTE
ncbi:MAG: hypothetical protein H6585_10180 [Flavobacteriales bacterium]|nr:hypothetical protein [Flavobacteriales bacterium]